jgi:hypothetical protein
MTRKKSAWRNAIIFRLKVSRYIGEMVRVQFDDLVGMTTRLRPLSIERLANESAELNAEY